MSSKYLGEGEMAKKQETREQREREALVSTDLAELEADRDRARRYFRLWLIGATVLTLVGNAAHAVIAGAATTPVRIAVHLVPPLIALVAIHAVTVLARVGGVHRADRPRLRDADGAMRVTIVGASAMATAAVVLSYAGLRGLAESAGMHGWLAVVYPLTIDVGIAVSSIALVALRPASSADLRTAKAAHTEALSAPEVSALRTTPPRTDTQVSASSAPSAPPPVHQNPAPMHSASAPLQRANTAPTPRPDALRMGAPMRSDEHLDRARSMVADGVVSIEPEKVAAVLAAVAGGASATRAAADAGVNRRTVAKILSAADTESDDHPAEPTRQLAAV